MASAMVKAEMGSIPAWAGETREHRRRDGRQAVDPRVGGGDYRDTVYGRLCEGRSPRGRGRRRQDLLLGQLERSIPAWAGETYAAAARA